MEIRLHGRGGQGGVTCAKILAWVYAETGKSVQTFGDYASERSGAPVQAFVRVADRPITNRNKVYHPDHLLVLDPTLLGVETVTGLAAGGLLLVNSPEPPEAFADRFGDFRVATVDATAIAREHGIGTRSVVITNTTMAGAYAKAMDLPLGLLEDCYRALGLLGNFEAAREAHDAVRVAAPVAAATGASEEGVAGSAADATASAATAQRPPVEPIAAHVEGPAPRLRTGTWRSQMPVYTEGLAPCNAWCPAGNDVIGFIQALARKGTDSASLILGQTTPLAGVCGRVCPAPCMEGCNRRELDGALHIRGLERFVADHAPVAHAVKTARHPPKRIAIVGGGPAGLSAAYALALGSHAVTIFEGEARLGGVLRTGIPEYRLPRKVVDQEIDAILALGVEARCGERLDRARLAQLCEEHDAVILATGLQRLRGLEVPGAAQEGIEQGIVFLHRVNLEGGARVHGRVVVLGGGNTAIDCARSALRCGAREVTVAYRRTDLEMPAIREEIEEAKEEGVHFLLQRQPVAFEGDGCVEAVTLAEVVMGDPDETGRRRPVVTDRTGTLACDQVLLALGQSADLSLLPEAWEVRDGCIFEGELQLPVFAAGDLATGDGTVAHAIGDGRRAAGRLLRSFGHQTEPFERPDRGRAVPATDIRLDHFARAPRAEQRRLPVDLRLGGFREVHGGLADDLEAHRCFSCGHCTECDTCMVYCPEGSIHRRRLGYDMDYVFCKGCGICAAECPRHGIEMVPTCPPS